MKSNQCNCKPAPPDQSGLPWFCEEKKKGGRDWLQCQRAASGPDSHLCTLYFLRGLGMDALSSLSPKKNGTHNPSDSAK